MKLKIVSLDYMIDKHIGKRGTSKRDEFENGLIRELLDKAGKKALLIKSKHHL